MDFHQLLAKMQELDGATQAPSTTEDGCGMPPPSMSNEPPTAPPSMSVNLNAQGLDNIEELMKLIMKVNPDMDKPSMPPMPTMSMEPSIASIKPSLPPLKMLPDIDSDNDEKIGGEKDMDQPGDLGASLDRDGDGDHDMKDHDLEKKEKEEEYANEPDTDVKNVDYMNNKLAGGMNRPKDTFPKVSDGDNPMKKKQFESGDLRSQIRAELQQRLAEAKGAK